MSEAAAKQFIEQLKSDENAREGLATAIRDGAAARVSQFGMTQGHEFSGAELVKAYEDMMRSHELSPEDIAQIASASGPAEAAYAAEPEASYTSHPAYAASPQSAAQYAEPTAASYADGASAHYAQSPSSDNS